MIFMFDPSSSYSAYSLTYSPSCFGGSFTRLDFPPNMVLSSCRGLAQQETSQCIWKGSTFKHQSPLRSYKSILVQYKSIFQTTRTSHGGNLGSFTVSVGKLFRLVVGIHPTTFQRSCHGFNPPNDPFFHIFTWLDFPS